MAPPQRKGVGGGGGAHLPQMLYPESAIGKGRFRGNAWGAEAPPSNFYHVQARKLLEVAV